MKFGDPNQAKYLANSYCQQLIMSPTKNKDPINERECVNVWIIGLLYEN